MRSYQVGLILALGLMQAKAFGITGSCEVTDVQVGYYSVILSVANCTNLPQEQWRFSLNFASNRSENYNNIQDIQKLHGAVEKGARAMVTANTAQLAKLNERRVLVNLEPTRGGFYLHSLSIE
jgi:hypothetical protein